MSLLLKTVRVEDHNIYRRIFFGSSVCRLSDALEISQKNFARVVRLTKYGKRFSGYASWPLALAVQDREGQKISGRDGYRRGYLKIFAHCEYLGCPAGIGRMAVPKNQYRARSPRTSDDSRTPSGSALGAVNGDVAEGDTR